MEYEMGVLIDYVIGITNTYKLIENTKVMDVRL